MENIIYRQATLEDIPLLVQNIIFSSMKPNNHCLHSWAGDTPADLIADFTAAFEDGELYYILAVSEPCIIGAMGGEYDYAMERVWLHGPHVFTGSWSLLATRLYEELMLVLPATAVRWDAFLNIKNSNGIDFYRKHGYTQGIISHDYHLNISRRVTFACDDCVLLKADQHDQFIELFSRLFPATYYSAQALIQMQGMSHFIHTIEDDGKLAGFSIAALESGSSKGEIQFLGVDEPWRAKGLGKRLMAKAVDYLFDNKEVTEIALNVEDNLTNARGLYESIGFVLSYSGLPLTRKKVKPLEL